jgi:hypothetical protein
MLKLIFEQKLMELYEDFKSGECSLGYLAEQLGILVKVFSLLNHRLTQITQMESYKHRRIFKYMKDNI